MPEQYRTYICGPSTCPNDSRFEHDNYFGCVPKDFSPTTGRSKTFRQVKTNVPAPGVPGEYRWKWNGGCDAPRATQGGEG